MAALTDAGWTAAHEVCESPAGVGGVYGCAALRAGQSNTERSERRHCAGCEAARATVRVWDAKRSHQPMVDHCPV